MQPVEDVGYGFHGLAHVPVAEVLLGRHDLHAELFELALDDRRFDVVAEDAGAHVDDYEVDVALLDDPLHELAEERALLDRLAGVAGLDVLADVDRAEGALFRRGRSPLSVDAVAVLHGIGIRVRLGFG